MNLTPSRNSFYFSTDTVYPVVAIISGIGGRGGLGIVFDDRHIPRLIDIESLGRPCNHLWPAEYAGRDWPQHRNAREAAGHWIAMEWEWPVTPDAQPTDGRHDRSSRNKSRTHRRRGSRSSKPATDPVRALADEPEQNHSTRGDRQ